MNEGNTELLLAGAQVIVALEELGIETNSYQ